MAERLVVESVAVFSVVVLAPVDIVVFSADVKAPGVIVTIADALVLIVELVDTLDL